MSKEWQAMEDWNNQKDSKTFNTYCLGGPLGMTEKCNQCQSQVNWVSLNQMPDALRKRLQSHMTRVDEDRCAGTKGTLFKPKV